MSNTSSVTPDPVPVKIGNTNVYELPNGRGINLQVLVKSIDQPEIYAAVDQVNIHGKEHPVYITFRGNSLTMQDARALIDVLQTAIAIGEKHEASR